MAIQRLAEEVIDQIAAGEVVERPASVVKELLENALDAAAKSIQIEVTGGGDERIAVSDDGLGIPAAEIQLAFSRHATSKLRATGDLARLNTLGFRGEALATIAAVSQLTAITRHQDDRLGTRVFLEGGKWRRQQSEPSPRGSTFIVENLFFNTPARLKFLKHPNTEKRQLARVVERYAFLYSDVRFSYLQEGKVRFHTSGNGNRFDTLVNVLGLAHARQMMPLPAAELRGLAALRGSIQISGFTSAPSLHRADRNQIAIFVNDRWIQDTRLMYAINRAYENILLAGRFPYAFIDIQMPKDQVDVNVHPTKSEVRFQQPETVFAAVFQAIQNAHLATETNPVSLAFTAQHAETRKRWFDEWVGPPEYRSTELREVAEEDLGEERALPPRTLPPLRVVGQIGAQFIVAEGPAGIYLIDQHAAHHRLLFEQMKAESEQGELAPQELSQTHHQNLAEGAAERIHNLQEHLEPLGISVESFGPNRFAIRALPRQCLQPHCEVDQFLPALAAADPSEKDKLLNVLTAQAAYRDGQLLSMEQQQHLTRALERCPNPLESPQGSPTLIHITRDQLAREFRR
ncbi:MAG: DNA mismatch repair endonuclease MutL [Anaerolineaceae bacterium]|nr:DNA mismatch repair endonuclease MutL [Anaerolineaceae bacterium]